MLDSKYITFIGKKKSLLRENIDFPIFRLYWRPQGSCGHPPEPGQRCVLLPLPVGPQFQRKGNPRGRFPSICKFHFSRPFPTFPLFCLFRISRHFFREWSLKKIKFSTFEPFFRSLTYMKKRAICTVPYRILRIWTLDLTMGKSCGSESWECVLYLGTVHFKPLFLIRIRRILKFLRRPDPLVICTDPNLDFDKVSDPTIIKQKEKPWFLLFSDFFYDFLSEKNDVNVPSKSNKQKTLKVTEEKSRILCRSRIRSKCHGSGTLF